MIRIIMTDETGNHVMEAEVNTERRAVTRLSLDESYRSVVNAFVGLSTLTGCIEAELSAEDARMKSNPFKPALTAGQMATAMGLQVEVFQRKCEDCAHDAAWVQNGELLIEATHRKGWCDGCLPSAFDRHMREQAALNRLVEADQPPTGKGGDQ